MSKIAFAIKLDEGVLNRLKKFCMSHGIKYSFFVEKAIEKELAEAETKEDLLDLKTLRKEEAHAVPFEDYLRAHNV